MSVVKEIVFLRGRPEFKAVNEIANLLLQPARSTKKRRRLNDGQHLDTGHREEEGGQEEKVEEEILIGKLKCFNQVERALDLLRCSLNKYMK